MWEDWYCNNVPFLFFFFSFRFRGYISRKLRKNDRHDVSFVIVEEDEGSEINGEEQMGDRLDILEKVVKIA